MRLQGKSAIVTGGASGFGAGIVQKFVAEGARVMIADVNEADSVAIADKYDASVRVKRCDISKYEDVCALVSTTHDAFGSVDIVVNNAGVTHLPMPMEQVDETDFDRIMSVNVKAVYFMARQVVPLMKDKGQGCILNIASTGGVSPRPNLTWYNASKGWMNTATRGMAVELAPFGIRVNALNPVAGETPLLKSFMGEDTPEVRARFLSTIPLGRFSTPQDMGNAACYLCSDEASMVTGVCLEVDGGRCI
ncbi:SDR family oxidoreductase [bacterium]|nr:SDR family oxidoreductase [bacterium]